MQVSCFRMPCRGCSLYTYFPLAATIAVAGSERNLGVAILLWCPPTTHFAIRASCGFCIPIDFEVTRVVATLPRLPTIVGHCRSNQPDAMLLLAVHDVSLR